MVTDGDLALQWLAEQKPDAALIEWMVAEVSGLELCRRIRQNHDLRDLPIIMLTRRGSDDDRVRGLELGADDYIVKPFNSRELIARLRGVLRRCYPQRHLELLRYHDIEMDTAMCRVTRGGLLIHLGPKEYRLLRVLLEAPRRAFTRQQLIDAVSGYNSFLDERTIDVFVRRLRIALGSAAGKGPLRTVRGVGYALELTCPR